MSGHLESLSQPSPIPRLPLSFLKGSNYKPFQPFYTKDSSRLSFIGKLITLCTRATQAILNYTSIREFRQCFFPVEYTQCLYSHCQIEIYWYIFVNYCWFVYTFLTDLLLLVKDFVKFLEKHPSVFIFTFQDCLSFKPPWAFLVSLFCFYK